MIKELCNQMKKLIGKELRKVLVGVLSCCMFLCGCKSASNEEISWQLEESTSEMDTSESETYDNLEKEAEKTAILEERKIYVYLCGAVVNPGVYQLVEGSRLYEAIEVAGGMLEDADVTCQNLARVLQDGEQIQILTKSEMEAMEEAGIFTQTGNTTSSNGLVNINTATVQELTTLSGIGESRAQAIVEYRESNGLFKNIEGIKQVTGIKEGLYEKIKDKITI